MNTPFSFHVTLDEGLADSLKKFNAFPHKQQKEAIYSFRRVLNFFTPKEIRDFKRALDNGLVRGTFSHADFLGTMAYIQLSREGHKDDSQEKILQRRRELQIKVEDSLPGHLDNIEWWFNNIMGIKTTDHPTRQKRNSRRIQQLRNESALLKKQGKHGEAASNEKIIRLLSEEDARINNGTICIFTVIVRTCIHDHLEFVKRQMAH